MEVIFWDKVYEKKVLHIQSKDLLKKLNADQKPRFSDFKNQNPLRGSSMKDFQNNLKSKRLAKIVINVNIDEEDEVNYKLILLNLAEKNKRKNVLTPFLNIIQDDQERNKIMANEKRKGKMSKNTQIDSFTIQNIASYSFLYCNRKKNIKADKISNNLNKRNEYINNIKNFDHGNFQTSNKRVKKSEALRSLMSQDLIDNGRVNEINQNGLIKNLNRKISEGNFSKISNF
jgi:hypothetical protein